MTTTLLIKATAGSVIEVAGRRIITLKVDQAVSGQGVQTSEFELPDAEFEYAF
jgi:hypothetical protein